MRLKLLKTFLLVFAAVGVCSCSPNSSSGDTSGSTATTEDTYNRNPSTHETGTYKNAVYGHGADPTIFRDPKTGTFYCYPTQDNYDWEGDGHSFTAYGPILKSSNMVDWTYVGQVFEGRENLPDWLTNKEGDYVSDRSIWAPHMVENNGTYYYYYSLAKWGGDNNGIGVATSNSPEGPFVDHGKIIDNVSTDSGECIDPCVVIVDGKFYMTYGSFDYIGIIELTDDGLHPKYVDNEGNVEYTKIANSSYEGSFIIKMYGYWYLFVSAGTCCQGKNSTYFVNVYKSKNFNGPYIDKLGKPATISGSGTAVLLPSANGSLAAGTGHNSVIADDDGVFWICYHAYDKTQASPDRSLCIDRLFFDDKYFPYVENYCSTMAKEGTKAPYVA